MVCLDTSFLVKLVRTKREADGKLRHYLEKDEGITTTPVNAAELLEGAGYWCWNPFARALGSSDKILIPVR